MLRVRACVLVVLTFTACTTVDPGVTAEPPPILRPGDFRAAGPRPEPAVPGSRTAIQPEVDALEVIAGHPAGTTFVFEPGVHRLVERIEPRDGDRFVGLSGAVLNGSRRLTSFTRDGSLWAAAGQTQQIDPAGECRTEAPRCDHPEQLFLDDTPLLHVASKNDVGPGRWYFDYEQDTIYLGDDPTGRLVETSIASSAFYGAANDVTIENLVIEKFATRAQIGAIHAYRHGGVGERWTIINNEVRLNHGVGINAGHGAIVRENDIHHNGQLGIASNGGRGTLIEHNEIAYNNTAGFNNSWEAGGSKFVQTDSLTVRNNYVHHNDGPGLWTDIDNIHTLYEYNLVEHNVHTGIFHEISYDAIIRHNTVLNNGYGRGYDRYCYVHCAGILVYASPNVTIHDNTVLDNWNGITGRYGGRGTGAYGPYLLTDLHVHDNTITLPYHADGLDAQGNRGVHALTGIVQDHGTEAFTTQANNRYERNHYRAADPSALHFAWSSGTRTFQSWQDYGQDSGGTIVRY